jgi:two-component system, cell cycle sensor histidine kinase PleC
MTSCPPPLCALATGEDTAAASDPPSFVIDGAGVLVAANPAGRQAWGLTDGADLGPVALDRAMPALARLPQAARSGDTETLTFWTTRGLLVLRCRVEAIAADPARFLVRVLSGGGVGPLRSGRDGGEPARPGRVRHDAGQDAAPIPDLARLAHEVRTPLSAAIAYAELLKEEHFGPLGSARYREYARNVYDSARLALSVVDGMLASERGGTGLAELAFRDLDPAGVIDNCVAVARPLAERAGLALSASHDPGTPRVIADEVSLKQMLLNLITNAIKFARPGDRVTLTASYGADGCLRIEVADTGPGMSGLPMIPGAMAGVDAKPPLPAPRTWGLEDAAAGRGIGLPLTRALAEANGASLIVDSAPGRGTRVTIAFGKDRVVPV